jgi:multidrug efflux pump
MARFFIDRPIFAWVIAIIVMVAGVLSLTQLPIARYPTIAPPSVTISATYPGAAASTVEGSVTQVIEQSMKGLDGLLYMASTSDSSGRVSISLTFASGTNPDIAQVQVQNKLQLAMPLLPQAVQQQGVSVTKASGSFLQVIGFVSEDGSMDRGDIADFVGSTLVDPLSRVPGVGNLQVFGSRYAMRIWLDPARLQAFALTPADAIAAVRAQNAQVSVGQLGEPPAVDGQEINATIIAQGRLETPEQFRDVILRSGADGSTVRLGDIARIELGSETYAFISRYNGKPATGLAVSLATDANALDTAAGVRRALEQLAPSFPPGLSAVVPFDTTPFIRVSIQGVLQTLAEAVVLVFLVMFLFLQNFRATLIPTIAIPVVLLGSFAVLGAFGMSINMLTMFAMVLAIGLLVDDAIVVVENVERVMSEEGLPPLEATRKSMDQITGALVGIGLVLSAVFVPMAFLGGSTGVIYRQFSVTIVSAMALSVLVAIVLTPALCATLLKPVQQGHGLARGGFFGRFNRGFDRTNARYRGGVTGLMNRAGRTMAIYGLLVLLMAWLFLRLPTAFLPAEDQGVLISQIQAPVGATQQRTMDVVKALEDHFIEDEADNIESVFTVQGFSFTGMGQNTGIGFVKLADWDERRDAARSVNAIAGRAMAAFSQIKDAMVFAFSPPAVPELGIAGGFTFHLQDVAGAGHDALLGARNQFLAAAGQSRLLASVRPGGQEDTPQLRLDIDARRAGAAGLSIADINQTLSIAWGGSYIDDFVDRGRIKRVLMQADAPFRMTPEDFRHWYVRNRQGEMVPFSTFASWRWDFGPARLERFDGMASMQIQGEAAPGVSSGEAMADVERIVGELPAGLAVAWSGQSYQERQAGAQTTLLYVLSLLLVFLCLAALYESWSIPTAVLMMAPLGVLGAVLMTWLRGMERDVYFQVAMLTTVGLSSKNAIMIVAFAQNYMRDGLDAVDAILRAVRDRLRPIIMTSLAFGFGVLPLFIASGAGSGAQRAIGTGVIGGMLAGTFLGIFFIPVFFLVVIRLAARLRRSGGRAGDVRSPA